MLRPALILAAAALLAWALAAGPLAAPLEAALRPLGQWLLAQNRAFQTGLAMELRGLATGQQAALWGLLGLCFAYGFLHAAGPGHGKAVLAAYAAARPAGALALAAVGLAAGLGQATVAVLAVLALAATLGLSRSRIEALDQTTLAPLALAAAAALGAWLVWRAMRRLRAPAAAPAAIRGPATALLAGRPAPATTYCADPACDDCGRPHLPDAARLARARNLRERAAVIAAAAIRPCSGALLLLLLAWQMGMLWVGILGTYAMGLGTAAVTVTVALAAGAGRTGLMRSAASGRAPRLAALIEGATGLALLVASAALVAALP
jgi:nickel/cobalt transporter (NicO) family protein